ncbi:MAG: hypothetical protein IKP62_07365 [Salinivirgaceae bacterium]|nr:hypothetical protein [Salinivirgaceae bacterium]
MNKTIITAALAFSAAISIFSLASCSRNDVIESPGSMGCLNLEPGNLKTTRVVTTDTATTIWFRMDFPAGAGFLYSSKSYLKDEVGKRYSLRSAEGIKLDEVIQKSDSNALEFKMNFEPLSREVQLFDFIEGDNRRAFKLLGIHDKKLEQNTPTFEQLAAANPYTVPDNWFTTDTITIRGRIEGYNAEDFGLTSLQCYFYDVLEKNKSVVTGFEIAADGSFENRFRVNHPVRQSLWAPNNKNADFDQIDFYACPGETIDITVRKNQYGKYECFYNNGSSKQVERWLKADLIPAYWGTQLYMFNGNFEEEIKLAEKCWNDLVFRLAIIGRRNHFTPMEMQLALAEIQAEIVSDFMSYALIRDDALMKPSDGMVVISNYEDFVNNITDTAEYNSLRNFKNFKLLQSVDFDNPLMMVSNRYSSAQNYIEFSKPIDNVRFRFWSNWSEGTTHKDELDTIYAAYRKLMGCDHNNLMAQICVLRYLYNSRGMNRETMEMNLPYFTNQTVRDKAELYIASQFAKTEPASALPANNSAANFIRSFNTRYPGRFLLFDFWGMGCGPCRGAIQASKQQRAEIAKRTDVKLIFVAEESVSGSSDDYKNYVKEWLDGEETVCVSHNEFVRLQELFQFSGIPHYETITPDGLRVREDLQLKGRPLNINDERMNQLRESLKN